jgi:hypothetical protein
VTRYSYIAGTTKALHDLRLAKQANLVSPALLGGALGAAAGGVSAGEGNRLEGALLGGALGTAGGAGGAALGRHAGEHLSALAEREFHDVMKARAAAEAVGALIPSSSNAHANMLRAWSAEPWIQHAGTAGGAALGMNAAARMAPGPAPQPRQDPYGYYQY